MRASIQRAVPGLEKRTFQGNTVTRCGLTGWGNGEVQGDGQILNSGWLVSHCLTQVTWEERQVGVGPMLNLSENMLCWRTHETSSLTVCPKDFRTVFWIVPIPISSLSLPASILASPTKTKSSNQNS